MIGFLAGRPGRYRLRRSELKITHDILYEALAVVADLSYRLAADPKNSSI